MNDYFCVAPFFAAEYQINNKTPCCLIPNGADVTRIQKDMLAKKRTPACQACWHLEDQGVISDRQTKNQTFDFYSNRDIRFIEEDCRSGAYSEQMVKINTSTLCNSTCVTCKEFHVSSAWETLLSKNTKKISIESDTLSGIDFKNLKMLSLLGGEPLYEKKNFDLLKNLIEVGNTDCFISIVTNGSVELVDKQIDILKQFSNLNFCLSVDGVGPVFEYMRYPLKWQTLVTNLELYKSLGIHVSASYTISNLNIAYYNETVEWFKSNGINYNHSLVSVPVHYSPNSLPLHVKEQLSEVTHLFRSHSAADDTNFKKALEDIALQDNLKGISIKDYLPELLSLLKAS